MTHEPNSLEPAATSNSGCFDVLFFTSLAVIAFGGICVIGRILVLSDTVAWISNGVLIAFHIGILVWLISLYGRRLWNTYVKGTDTVRAADIRMVGLFFFVVSIFSGLSGYVLAIKPSDHLHLATLATGFSLVGAIFEKRILWGGFWKRWRLNVSIRNGDYEAALAILAPALRSKHPSKSDLDYAAAIYGKLGRNDEAISFRERLLEMDRSPINLNMAAVAYFEAERFSEGYPLIEETLHKNGSLVIALVNQCLFLLKLERTGEARHAWQELKRIHRTELCAFIKDENTRNAIQKIRTELNDIDEL